MLFSDQEIQEFKVEALELLESTEKSLLSLDQGANFDEAFNNIFRGFHSLKGASAMMELTKLQAHTHELENILIQFKTANGIPKEHVNLFLRGVDACRVLLDGGHVNFSYSATATPATKKPEPETITMPVPEIPDAVMQEFLAESEEILERVSKTFQEIELNQYSKESVDALYRDVHSLKGAAYLFSFTKLGDLAHAMESSLENIRNGTHKASKPLVNTLFKCMEVMEHLIQKIKVKQDDSEMSELVKVLAESLQLSSENLELVTTAPVAPVTAAPKEIETDGASSIRVPVALLDNLMTLMGEMVLVRNQVLQYANRSEDLEFLSMSKRLNVVTSEIQGGMMKTRMQPIGNILSKFKRVVRDLSQELQKNISLDIQGAETELDKSLLEAIKDPLTHIVRNSCDHGLETPSNRIKLGKSETGLIQIKSYHEGGQVVIEVSDDGKGLQKEMLIQKALEKNLIQQVQVSRMSEKEIFNLIFAPGFSTAAKVTSVSGRGVGMDVVRTNIEKIGGTVDLSSVAGKGTTIKIKVPLTLAIVPALMVKCGDGTFAIPQVKLEELVRVDQNSLDNRIEVLHGSPVYRLRGQILPLADMNQVLGLKPLGTPEFKNPIVNIAVLNSEQGSFGVIIDEILDSADIVVKPLNRLLKSLQIYSGATVLGDGSVALIFDVVGISKCAHTAREKNQNLEESSQTTSKRRVTSEMQDFLMVRLNSPTKHAFVLNSVHRLEEFAAKDIEVSGTQRVIRYRDIILPLISTNTQLGYTETEYTGAKISVIVVQRAGVLYGLEVNEVLDTLSTEVETVPSLVKHPGILANLNMPDELIVIIDAFEIIFKAFPDLVVEPPVPVAPKNTVPPIIHGTQKILLVEDTVFFKRAIKNVLEGAGYEVLTASDGEEALEILGTHAGFNLIVSDIEMPRVNGFQLASSVRKNSIYGKIPMLAISSRADQKYRQDGLNAGFDLYLEKMKPDVLLAAAGNLIQQKAGNA